MEILQLKYFQHTAKRENISHTAQQFMVPPSSVSASIKKLESELGIKLFDRTSNSLKLNEYGKIFLEAVEASEKKFKQAKIDILNLSQTPCGEINLLILTNRQMVTEIISKFKVSYPNITFKIKHEDYADYSTYHNYDIIISDRHITLDSFKGHLYVSEEVFLAVHKNHPLARQSVVNFENMQKEKFICMPKGSSLGDYMDKIFKKAGFEPDVIIECDDPHYIREYLKIGLGVTFFPSVSWKKQINENIKLLRVNDGIYRDSYIYIKNSSSDAVNLFAQTLEMA